MNPYVATAVAMCVIVALSLAGTAYLAVYFNRRAKADLATRLAPLAEAIAGTVDLDEATVKGRHAGRIVSGRVASAPGGFGRLFHVEVVDAAGGAAWEWSSLPEKNLPAPRRTFEGDTALADRLGVDWEALTAVVPEAATQRFGFAYDPAPGKVRLTREMRTRLDIPDAATFLRQLDALLILGDVNRHAQGTPDHPATVGADDHVSIGAPVPNGTDRVDHG